MNASTIRTNYLKVLEGIERAAGLAGRDPSDVKMVVVTKTHSIETVEAVLDAGARYLGENYVEEARTKIEWIGPRTGIEWHMIGHIQSRKTRLVNDYFQYVHSLDRLKTARGLSRAAEEQGKRLPVLLECNVSGEESKFGWPAWQEAAWSELIAPVKEILGLPNLDVRGLMTMAPYSSDPDQARPFFRRLRRLAAFFKERFPELEWEELSMGMTGDFETAIQEGATWVRIGTAILGERV
jgi:PLP dependent protein